MRKKCFDVKKKIRIGKEIKEMSCGEVFIQYERLLYKMCLKYINVEPCFDDLYQNASVALVMAYNKYSNLDFVFSTYLEVVVRNYILEHYRKQKNECKCISLNCSVTENAEGDKMTICDTITDTKNYFDDFIEVDDFIKFYDSLSSRQKIIIDGLRQGKTQKVIAEELNLNKITIGREFKKIKSLLKNYREKGE